MEQQSLEEIAAEVERVAFLNWLDRTCKFVRSKLLEDQETASYSLTVTIPSKEDDQMYYEVQITAKRRENERSEQSNA